MTNETGTSNHNKTPLALIFRGFCMGCADIIPGVSGGTVALIMGIYQNFLEAIRSFSPSTVLAFLKALLSRSRDQIFFTGRALHLDFLIPLGCGLIMAILIASRILPPLIESYPQEVNALFFGLILASAAIPFLHMENRSFVHIGIAAVAFIFAFWLTAVAAFQVDASPLGLFAAGFVSISAMVLPGLSGAYLLKVAGLYKPILDTLRAASSFDLGSLSLILCFIAGIGLGLPIFVRFLLILLRKAQSGTMAALTGLMLGALGSVWPYRKPIAIGTAPRLPEAQDPLLFPVIMAILGLSIVGFLVYTEQRKHSKV